VPDIRPAALAKRLQQPAGGVFFFHGEEVFLREEAVRRAIDAHLDPASRDFNLDQLRAGEVSGEALASMIATPPMMAEWRVVVLRDAQALSNKAREALVETAAGPPPGLVLVVTADIPSGSRAKFYRDLRKHAHSVEFSALSEGDAPGWLMEEAEGLERRLEPEAARLLVSALGTSLGTLRAELEKLVAYVGDRPAITAEDVRAATKAVPRQDWWGWFDLVGERRMAEARHALPALLESGESAVRVVAGIGTHLLRVAIGVVGGKAALEAELPPYQRWLAGKMAGQARRWSAAEVEAALSEALRTDRLLKSASLTDIQALEELLLRLQSIDGGRVAA
jgi:DNA polymerase III subunit delta